MKEYKINFLSNLEFDNLPYQRVKDSVGCADPKTRTAYVRKSGIPVVDQFVSVHEIDELIKKNSNHEDTDGIRYKTSSGQGSFWDQVVDIVTGRNTSGGVGMENQSASGSSSTDRQQQQMNQPIGGSGPSQSTQPTGSLGAGGTGGLGTNNNTNIPTTNYGSWGETYVPPSTPTSYTPTTNNSSSLGFNNQNNSQNSGFNSSSGNNSLNWGQAGNQGIAPVINPYNPNTNATLPSGQVVSSSTPYTSSMGLGFNIKPGVAQINTNQTNPISWGQNNIARSPTVSQPVTSNVSNNQTSTAGNLGFNGTNNVAPTPVQNQVPQTMRSSDISPQINVGGRETSQATKTPALDGLLGKDWRRTLLGASIPLVTQMFSKKTEPFNPQESQIFRETQDMIKQGPTVELAPAQQKAITANYDTQLEQARQNLMDRYKGLRPGSDISNDSQFKEAMIELESDFAEKKANALTSAQLGLGAQQAEMMSQLAAFDIYSLSQKAGISAQEASQFKQMMAELGYMVAGSGDNRMYNSNQMRMR